MRRLLYICLLCLITISLAGAEENWVFFHNSKEYYFMPPSMGIPLKPLYQRETYYYDEGSLQTSGLLVWKRARARIKIESWGIYSNSETFQHWEVDCDSKLVNRQTRDGKPISSRSVDTGDEGADAFYKALCL